MFSDRHAYVELARYFNSTEDLDRIDWPLLQARNFSRNPDDPGQIERYQAEALVYRHLPIEGLMGAICYTEQLRADLAAMVQSAGGALEIHARPQWYFP